MYNKKVKETGVFLFIYRGERLLGEFGIHIMTLYMIWDALYA